MVPPRTLLEQRLGSRPMRIKLVTCLSIYTPGVAGDGRALRQVLEFVGWACEPGLEDNAM